MDYFADDDNDSKRTLTTRDRQFLYQNAKGRCQNPACNKKVSYFDMQVGHKTAWSKGGKTTLKNSVCLCYGCNKKQGTDSWATFLKKQGIQDAKSTLKKSLQGLTLTQLKNLAKQHKIVVKGHIEEGIFETKRTAPTKSQYVAKLSGIVTEKEMMALAAETPKPAKKRKKKQSTSW